MVKDKLYQLFTSYEEKIDILSEMRSMNLQNDLFDALLEVMLD
ncbi:hypothetical protein J2S11_001638 [Bacillus horti]|uniref:Uncharacterized protein n=1 Tax=Caldalkalibacillus horti TaxID=77523 RepID=A0ABT9VY45_9BACI|nr:hypothetical protein [Bacillus horti]